MRVPDRTFYKVYLEKQADTLRYPINIGSYSELSLDLDSRRLGTRVTLIGTIQGSSQVNPSSPPFRFLAIIASKFAHTYPTSEGL